MLIKLESLRDKVLDGHRLYVARVCKCMVEPYRLIIGKPVLSLVHIASYLSLLYYCYN